MTSLKNLDSLEFRLASALKNKLDFWYKKRREKEKQETKTSGGFRKSTARPGNLEMCVFLMAEIVTEEIHCVVKTIISPSWL